MCAYSEVDLLLVEDNPDDVRAHAARIASRAFGKQHLRRPRWRRGT